MCISGYTLSICPGSCFFPSLQAPSLNVSSFTASLPSMVHTLHVFTFQNIKQYKNSTWKRPAFVLLVQSLQQFYDMN